jgi:hypothetical protein
MKALEQMSRRIVFMVKNRITRKRRERVVRKMADWRTPLGAVSHAKSILLYIA